MKTQITKFCTTNNCAIIACIFLALSFIPLPSIVINARGALLCDYQYFICLYGLLLTLLFYISGTTNHLVFKILTALAFGKFVDQFQKNPYHWSDTEKIYDFIVLIYFCFKQWKQWRKTKV